MSRFSYDIKIFHIFIFILCNILSYMIPQNPKTPNVWTIRIEFKKWNIIIPAANLQNRINQYEFEKVIIIFCPGGAGSFKKYKKVK